MAVRFRRAFSLLTAVAAAVSSCAGPSGVRSLAANETPPFPTDPATSEPVPSGSDPSLPSGSGIGDELFPALGSPGIDVSGYDLDLRYDTSSGRLDATVGIDLTLLDERDEIALDAVGLDVRGVTVNGAASEFRVDPEDLQIPVPSEVGAGDVLSVAVEYGVDAGPRSSPIGMPVGWFDTEGGSYVLNEPDGARTWMPCNDHPSDKARYDITITVPEGTTGVANGVLLDHRTEGGSEVWHWQVSTPMATYLLLVLTGDYEIIEGTGPDGLPLQSAVLRDDVAVMQPYLDVTAEQIAWFEQWFGPYPFDVYGLAMTDSDPGLAMETQTRSLFSRGDFLSGALDYVPQMLLSHELAHQWFGDAVTPSRWTDIWLNESFATYAEWMWIDHVGLEPLDSAADWALRERPLGSSARPTVDEMFGYNSYSGGAVVLHALRLTVGDDAFFETLREWAQGNLGESRSTADFIDLAEAVSDRSLGDFFDTWLFADRPPAQYPVYAGV